MTIAGCYVFKSGGGLLAALALVVVATAAAQPLPAPVARKLTANHVSHKSIGIFVQNVATDKPLLTFNADRPFNPASAIKLLTTYAALDALGPAYNWTTQAYAGGPVERGRLHGDLILKGNGDPFFVMESLWRLLRALRQRGLERIDGDLVLDNHLFNVPRLDPAAFDGNGHRPYNALPDALLFNFQTVGFTFTPDHRTGKIAIAADPPLVDAHLQNRLQVTQKRCRGRRPPVQLQVGRTAGHTTVTFSGSYPLGCGTYTLYRVVADSATLLFGAFRSIWQELGGGFEGKLRLAPVPAQAQLLHAQSSRPLAELIRAMNKLSNNVMTRQLLLTLAAERQGVPADTAKGAAAIRAWLQAKRLDFPELVLDNGAGLSRRTRISAHSLGRLLLTAYQSPYQAELLASLPLAGVDGTVRRRFVGTPLAGRLRLKTGTLNGVKTIAGYVLSRSGRMFVVVALQNQPGINNGAGTAVQDALLGWVFEQ